VGVGVAGAGEGKERWWDRMDGAVLSSSTSVRGRKVGKCGRLRRPRGMSQGRARRLTRLLVSRHAGSLEHSQEAVLLPWQPTSPYHTRRTAQISR